MGYDVHGWLAVYRIDLELAQQNWEQAFASDFLIFAQGVSYGL